MASQFDCRSFSWRSLRLRARIFSRKGARLAKVFLKSVKVRYYLFDYSNVKLSTKTFEKSPDSMFE